MSKVDEILWGWLALSRPDRARFLALLREHYAREREARMRANGGPDRGPSNFSDLVVTEADLMDADDGHARQ
jgi:hypothetical protein